MSDKRAVNQTVKYPLGDSSYPFFLPPGASDGAERVWGRRGDADNNIYATLIYICTQDIYRYAVFQNNSGMAQS